MFYIYIYTYVYLYVDMRIELVLRDAGVSALGRRGSLPPSPSLSISISLHCTLSFSRPGVLVLRRKGAALESHFTAARIDLA